VEKDVIFKNLVSGSIKFQIYCKIINPLKTEKKYNLSKE
jgi:hypothetical protein